jgi:excisionase family DNA binding protein
MAEIGGILEQFADLVAAKLAAQLQNNHNSPFNPRLLTLEQAGTYIGRSREAVQSLVATGKLPTVRSDRRVFLDVKDLDRWIEEHKKDQGD